MEHTSTHSHIILVCWNDPGFSSFSTQKSKMIMNWNFCHSFQILVFQWRLWSVEDQRREKRLPVLGSFSFWLPKAGLNLGILSSIYFECSLTKWKRLVYKDILHCGLSFDISTACLVFIQVYPLLEMKRRILIEVAERAHCHAVFIRVNSRVLCWHPSNGATLYVERKSSVLEFMLHFLFVLCFWRFCVSSTKF